MVFFTCCSDVGVPLAVSTTGGGSETRALEVEGKSTVSPSESVHSTHQTHSRKRNQASNPASLTNAPAYSIKVEHRDKHEKTGGYLRHRLTDTATRETQRQNVVKSEFIFKRST